MWVCLHKGLYSSVNNNCSMVLKKCMPDSFKIMLKYSYEKFPFNLLLYSNIFNIGYDITWIFN